MSCVDIKYFGQSEPGDFNVNIRMDRDFALFVLHELSIVHRHILEI